MGSPLSPIIAIFFMEHFEKNAIEQVTHKPVSWFRYVNGTFVIWPYGQMTKVDSTTRNSLQWKRRRPPSIPRHLHLQKNGRLPSAQTISETHPYQSLPTPEFATPSI
jgi:hypothetical protein